jgi:beta-phosphoglucomutase-like phosphatase (HAD superfamily)
LHAAEHALDMAGLVVEDAPSGLIAGHAAGARTLAVCTTHTREMIVASGVAPDFIANDLTRYEIKRCDHCHWATLTAHLLGCLRNGMMVKLWSRSMTLRDEKRTH